MVILVGVESSTLPLQHDEYRRSARGRGSSAAPRRALPIAALPILCAVHERAGARNQNAPCAGNTTYDAGPGEADVDVLLRQGYHAPWCVRRHVRCSPHTAMCHALLRFSSLVLYAVSCIQLVICTEQLHMLLCPMNMFIRLRLRRTESHAGQKRPL